MIRQNNEQLPKFDTQDGELEAKYGLSTSVRN